MIEFGPSDCQLTEDIFNIKGFKFGIEAQVPLDIVRDQDQINLTQLQRNFAELIESEIVIRFPQLDRLKSEQFSAGLGEEDYEVSTATENLHKEPAGIISQALFPETKRLIATAIFPDKLGHLVPPLLVPKRKTEFVTRERLYAIINQVSELSLLTNLSATHFRLMPRKPNLDLSKEGTLHYKGLF